MAMMMMPSESDNVQCTPSVLRSLHKGEWYGVHLSVFECRQSHAIIPFILILRVWRIANHHWSTRHRQIVCGIVDW